MNEVASLEPHKLSTPKLFLLNKAKVNKTSPPNEFCQRVNSVKLGVARPLWSVLIPTYNCASYLEKTLSSVLKQEINQDCMEIIVIDDCSSDDDPGEVVSRLGKGRVQFIQQARNVGKTENYQTGLNASSGHLIHQLHGDDLVDDGFYLQMEQAFVQFPEAGAFFCESLYIDAEGITKGRTGKESEELTILENWMDKMVISQRIQTPSIVVKREVYETLGGFDSRLPYCEDWEMWVRVTTRFSFGFNPHALAKYRVFPENSSSKSIVTGERTRVIRKAIAIMDSYLPSNVIARCKTDRSKAMAHYLIRCVPSAVNARKPLAWLRLVWGVFRLSPRPRELYYLLIFTFNYKQYISSE